MHGFYFLLAHSFPGSFYKRSILSEIFSNYLFELKVRLRFRKHFLYGEQPSAPAESCWSKQEVAKAFSISTDCNAKSIEQRQPNACLMHVQHLNNTHLHTTKNPLWCFCISPSESFAVLYSCKEKIFSCGDQSGHLQYINLNLLANKVHFSLLCIQQGFL